MFNANWRITSGGGTQVRVSTPDDDGPSRVVYFDQQLRVEGKVGVVSESLRKSMKREAARFLQENG